MRGIQLSPRRREEQRANEQEEVSGKGIAPGVNSTNIPHAADTEQQAEWRLRVSVLENQIREF